MIKKMRSQFAFCATKSLAVKYLHILQEGKQTKCRICYDCAHRHCRARAPSLHQYQGAELPAPSSRLPVYQDFFTGTCCVLEISTRQCDTGGSRPVHQTFRMRSSGDAAVSIARRGENVRIRTDISSSRILP
jgi:hypothetical protein